MDCGKPFNLLIGSTGSVASVKVPILISKLKQKYEHIISIKLILTENAKFFLKGKELATLSSMCQIYDDPDEWINWKKIGDPILHIELMKEADMMIISPLDANTLAKLGNGMCDNLLCCVCRAWDFKKPIFFAPAMNTLMWQHPVTNVHTKNLKEFGYQMIDPISKRLACGDTGIGAMAEVDEIIKIVDMYIKANEI